MRRRLIRPGLPRNLANVQPEGIIWAGEVMICDRKKPSLKVLVFTSRRRMRKFWKEVLGGHLHNFSAAVTYCSHTSITFAGGKESAPVLYVQPNFVAVMGLVKGFITYEIIVHECVHAAEAWSERFPGYPWQGVKEVPVESICYPAGKFACQIIKHLTLEGLMNKNPHK